MNAIWRGKRHLTIGKHPSRKKARVIGFTYARQLMEYDISEYDPWYSRFYGDSKVRVFFAEFSFSLRSSGYSAGFVWRMSEYLFSGLEKNPQDNLFTPKIHGMYSGVSEGLRRARFTR